MILLTSPGMRHLVIAFAFASLVTACSDSDTPTDHVLAHSTELHQYNSCSDLSRTEGPAHPRSVGRHRLRR